MWAGKALHRVTGFPRFARYTARVVPQLPSPITVILGVLKCIILVETIVVKVSFSLEILYRFVKMNQEVKKHVLM